MQIGGHAAVEIPRARQSREQDTMLEATFSRREALEAIAGANSPSRMDTAMPGVKPDSRQEQQLPSEKRPPD